MTTAARVASRVKESTTTAGTGALTLGGVSAPDLQSFASAYTSGTQVAYVIVQSGAAWECGLGTFTAPSTLTRDVVRESSNGGALVSFTAGSKDVFAEVAGIDIDEPGLVPNALAASTVRVVRTGYDLVFGQNLTLDAGADIQLEAGSDLVGAI